MIDNFPRFAKIVAASFQAIVKHDNIFVVDVDGDALYQRYLAAFPDGTNPVFKERTEHDCSSCKQFVRRAGNVISVDEHGAIRTVWDDAAAKAAPPYDVVAAALRDAVLAADIAALFRVGQKEVGFGAVQTRSLD